MVEGGASVIKSFFTGVSNPSGNFVDAVIVTVAPVFVGQQGVGYDLNLQNVRCPITLTLFREAKLFSVTRITACTLRGCGERCGTDAEKSRICNLTSGVHQTYSESVSCHQ